MYIFKKYHLCIYNVSAWEIMALNTPVWSEIGYSMSDSLHSSVSDSVGCLSFTHFPALKFLWGVAAVSR